MHWGSTPTSTPTQKQGNWTTVNACTHDCVNGKEADHALAKACWTNFCNNHRHAVLVGQGRALTQTNLLQDTTTVFHV
jgi:hypothetical protein